MFNCIEYHLVWSLVLFLISSSNLAIMNSVHVVMQTTGLVGMFCSKSRCLPAVSFNIISHLEWDRISMWYVYIGVCFLASHQCLCTWPQWFFCKFSIAFIWDVACTCSVFLYKSVYKMPIGICNGRLYFLLSTKMAEWCGPIVLYFVLCMVLPFSNCN